MKWETRQDPFNGPCGLKNVNIRFGEIRVQTLT